MTLYLDVNYIDRFQKKEYLKQLEGRLAAIHGLGNQEPNFSMFENERPTGTW